MTEQWQELKETIIELRDNDGTGTQQEICKFLANYMDVLEEQMSEPKTIQEKQAESEKYQKAFDDGYENGYTQARFDYEQEPKTEKGIKMRRPTPEERESVEKYVKSISKPTGVNFWDLEQKAHVETLRQVMWERDIAIGQLRELGYSLGQKIETSNDSISRQTVLDMLEDINAETEGVGFYYKHYVEYIKKLPPVKPQEPKWISVNERLPEEAYGCLVTIEIDNVLTGECVPTILNYLVGYDGETWNNSDGIPLPYEVIAWMPLPEPYKAESEVQE